MKNEVVRILYELSTLESHQYKSRAYSTAADSISKLTSKDFMSRDDYRDIYGIGESINSKILEYKETRKVNKVESLRKENKEFLNPQLYKVRTNSVTKRVEYTEAWDVVYKIQGLIDDRATGLYAAGSLRRESKLVGDVDLLIHESEYSGVIEILSKKYDVASSGSFKSTFIFDLSNNFTFDVHKYTDEDFPFQLLYLTGSKHHNIKMRGIAKSKGLTLNQYGILDSNNEYVRDLDTEESIFEYLGMDYLEPKYR